MLMRVSSNIVHLGKKHRFSNGLFACFPMEALFSGLLPSNSALNHSTNGVMVDSPSKKQTCP